MLTFQTFADESEAIELANSTEYGLSAIVYTGSAGRAERVGRAVRAGTVWVNSFLVRDLTAPFGGMGISGMGREGGNYALDFYSDLKTLADPGGIDFLGRAAPPVEADGPRVDRVDHEMGPLHGRAQRDTDASSDSASTTCTPGGRRRAPPSTMNP